MRSPFIHEWVFAHAARRPDAPAVATPSARLSYGDLAHRVRNLADRLAARGVGAGDRVLLALPNTPATVVAGLALNSLGATSVEVDRTWSQEVLGAIVARCGARWAFTWGRDARTWGTILDGQAVERVWVVHRGPLPDTLRATLGAVPASLLDEDGEVDRNEPSKQHRRVEVGPDHPALILYTSGSTGVPHGVIQTFRNIDSNTRSIAQYLRLTAGDRALLTLPLFYCYGRSVLQTHLFAGGSVFLDNRFALPRVVLETLAAEGCTGFAGVPLTFEIIRRQVDVETIAFPRLRYVTQAGGAMATGTIAWARAAFAPAELFVMYGQTEATARLSYLPPERAALKEGSIGIPIPGVQLRVVDEEGRELPDGDVGNLVAHGENVTPGYLDAPDETSAILRDGWLWTGDLAHRDTDGFFFHRGRAKEIIKTGGHRVSPAEIEEVITSHPQVSDAAVRGLPHDLLGEVPVAFVVRAPGTSLEDSDLRRFCQQRLPTYAVPAGFTWMEALPRNEAGKLLRTALPGGDPAPVSNAGTG